MTLCRDLCAPERPDPYRVQRLDVCEQLQLEQDRRLLLDRPACVSTRTLHSLHHLTTVYLAVLASRPRRPKVTVRVILRSLANSVLSQYFHSRRRGPDGPGLCELYGMIVSEASLTQK
jgi:hypothetical protein